MGARIVNGKVVGTGPSGMQSRDWLLIALVIVVMIGAPTGLKYVRFNIGCAEYLVQAANANSAELAADRLDKVLLYASDRNWKDGDTTMVVFPYPTCDIGYWLRNIRSAREELRLLPRDASPLERSNVLMKLRESLMEGGGVILPPLLAYFPNQVAFVVLWVLGGLAAIICFIIALGSIK